jgi:hypothetical protein
VQAQAAIQTLRLRALPPRMLPVVRLLALLLTNLLLLMPRLLPLLAGF